ncbi:MAG: FAD-dependent oxidoreductase [Candidatus Bathyarchaeia archaeon]
MVEKFDCVVVGAGPAGVAAAMTAARAGLKVLQIERGDFAGSKNMFGGIVFRHAIEDLVGPNFWVTEPGRPPHVERYIVNYQYWFLTKGSHVAFSHRTESFEQNYNAFSALRARFDPWFARKAEQAGVTLVTKTTATEVLKHDGKIVGVKTDRGDVYGDITIAADGANSLLAKQAGLHGELRPEDVALGVKETIALPREKIEARFNLREDQGTAMVLIGYPLPGMGTGFLYTNKDTISFGIGVVLSHLAEGRNYKDHLALPNTLLENLKTHPSIKPLLEGGATREYTAHMIPEGGYKMVPPLYADGFLVVGDAAMLVNAFNFEGTNLAMTSGKLAGQTVAEAKKLNDFSAKALARYQKYLEESYVLKDLKRFRKVPTYFSRNKHFFEDYPEVLNEALHIWHTVDGRPKNETISEMKNAIWKRTGKLRLARDLYALWRNIL